MNENDTENRVENEELDQIIDAAIQDVAATASDVILEASSQEHVRPIAESHHEGHNHDHYDDEDFNLHIGYKEIKALKRSKYAEKRGSYLQAFILQNKRTGAIVEIEALNSFHACGMIGWKPSHVTLLETKDLTKVETTLETDAISEQD